MRVIFLFLFSVVLLIGCKTSERSRSLPRANSSPNSTSKPGPLIEDNSDDDNTNTDLIIADSIKIEKLRDYDTSVPRETRDLEVRELETMNMETEDVELTNTTTTTTTTNNNTIKLFPSNNNNNNTTNTTKNFPVGHIAYSVPDIMRIGNFHTISLVISKDTTKAQVNYIVNDLDNNTRESSTIIVNKIRVSPLMSAKLIDIEGNFIIKEISSTEQNVDKFGQTKWYWEVSPKKSGLRPLKLIISVKVKNEFGISSQDIPVFREKIFVESNFKWTFKTFFKSYWQWIISTLILPLLIYLWRRKKKKD